MATEQEQVEELEQMEQDLELDWKKKAFEKKVFTESLQEDSKLPLISTSDKARVLTEMLQEDPEKLVAFAESTFVRSFSAIQLLVHETAKDNGFWDQERNNSEMLMLMVSELVEGLENLRDGETPYARLPQFSGIEVGLADCIVRIMDMAGGRGYRVAEALIAKMKYNPSRGYKHGRKF